MAMFAAIYWWIWGYPLAIESAGELGGIDGINPSYDAVLLFEVGIGISWWIFLYPPFLPFGAHLRAS